LIAWIVARCSAAPQRPGCSAPRDRARSPHRCGHSRHGDAYRTRLLVILKSDVAIQPIDCLCDALERSTSVVITGTDNDAALDQTLTATKSFSPMGETADQAGAGRFELFRTTDHFDGTAHHPGWPGGDTAETVALAPKNGG
jgi:hypothetical protein